MPEMSDGDRSSDDGRARLKVNPVSEVRRHLLFLGMTIIAIVFSFALQVQPDEEHVAFDAWPDRPLPGSCFAREHLGTDCPGCGLTRSFIHFADGDLSLSYERHRVGWIMVLLVLLQIPYRLWMIRYPTSHGLGRLPDYVGFAAIVLLISNWVWNLVS